MRADAIVLLALAAACAPQAAETTSAALSPCGASAALTGELIASECRAQAGDDVLHVRYAALAAGTVAGTVSIDVLDEGGRVLQTLLEADVSEYRAPHIDDIDGDGRADILIPRETGNVNTTSGVWLFNGERARYERIGDISGVDVEATSDGYVAVPARSSASSWNVAFYRIDEGGLHPIATVTVEGEPLAGGAVRSTCTLGEAPGLRDVNLNEAEARAKFCAEPAAQVFE